MKKMLLLALLTVGLATQAVATDWVGLSFNDDGVTYGDVDSRTHNRAWFEERYKKPQKYLNNKFIIQMKSLREMDCSNRRYRILTFAVYSKSAKLVDSYTPPYGSKWEYVFPETSGEYMYNFVCNHEPR